MKPTCRNCHARPSINAPQIGFHAGGLVVLYQIVVCRECLEVLQVMVESVTSARQDPLLPGWATRSARDHGG